MALFDDAAAWLVARGQPGRWGTEPSSARPGAYERLGLHRVGSFDVGGCPGAVLARSVGR